MKIYYIVNARIPTDNAHGVQIMHTCEAVAAAGADLELVVPRRLNKEKTDPYTFYSVKKNFNIKRLPCLDLVCLGSLGFWLQEKTFALSALIYTLLRAARGAIIYVRGETLSAAISFLHRFHPFFIESHIKPARPGSYFELFRRMTGVCVVTSYYAREIEASGVAAERVLVAPDGVDLNLYATTLSRPELRASLSLPAKARIVGYVGKLTAMGHERGVAELVQSFALVHQSLPQAFLLIVGARPAERERVIEVATKAGLPRDSYTVIRHVPHATAIAYTQAADVLIMNYPDAHYYRYYLSPLKLFEYMATGNPIISTDLDSVRDIISESTAVLVKPGDAAALTTALHEVLSKPEVYALRAAAARQEVEQYTWEARAKHILAFIRTLSHE